MCGRYTLRTPASELVEIFQLVREMEYARRYNIAPTQSVPVIRQSGQFREMSLMNWGLIPSWSKDPKMGGRLINARADTVATIPSFRSAFRQRRCLIPADGFYEWKNVGGKMKQPYYISRPNGEPFAFAGLWEHWEKEISAIDSCTIITTDANDRLRELHDRMPVILHETDYDRWLAPKPRDTDELQKLLVPFDNEALTVRPVNTIVNNARIDSEACIEPAKVARDLFPESA